MAHTPRGADRDHRGDAGMGFPAAPGMPLLTDGLGRGAIAVPAEADLRSFRYPLDWKGPFPADHRSMVAHLCGVPHSYTRAWAMVRTTPVRQIDALPLPPGGRGRAS